MSQPIDYPRWSGTLTFLAGMLNRGDLIELIKIIGKDYFECYPNGHPDFEDYLFDPKVNAILLAGECFLEGRLKEEYFKLDKSLQEVYDAYTSAAAFTKFRSSFTGYDREGQAK